VYAVDYNNIDSLVKILEEKKVHTVISTLTMIYPEAAQAELNFITAADKASCTKRFVASNYGNAAPEEESFRQPFNASREQNAAALRKTNLEWTVFHNGWFLDYFGMPHVETYLTPFVFAIDIAHRQAALPGTNGEKPITFTYTKDLAKFVVAAMSLSKWDEALHCYSEQSSFANILALAEEMTGKQLCSLHQK
jgi:nucleoside-diphosphate-sugar epimerase